MLAPGSPQRSTHLLGDDDTRRCQGVKLGGEERSIISFIPARDATYSTAWLPTSETPPPVMSLEKMFTTGVGSLQKNVQPTEVLRLKLVLAAVGDNCQSQAGGGCGTGVVLSFFNS